MGDEMTGLLDDQGRKELDVILEGKSPDYIQGFIDGVRETSEDAVRYMADALIGLKALEQYLAEITSGE